MYKILLLSLSADLKNQTMTEHNFTFPCAYTHEQMEVSLQAAETDFRNGNYESHSSFCERYGV